MVGQNIIKIVMENCPGNDMKDKNNIEKHLVYLFFRDDKYNKE
jgi:hypothetical protein